MPSPLVFWGVDEDPPFLAMLWPSAPMMPVVCVVYLAAVSDLHNLILVSLQLFVLVLVTVFLFIFCLF